MFAIFVFRRCGLAVPVVFFVVSLLLEVCLDKTFGTEAGYYVTTHLWAMGLNLFLTGVLTGVPACVVADTNGNDPYRSLLLDHDFQEAAGNVKDTLEQFWTDESEDDTFCYIPLNRCSLALMVMGLALIAADRLLL